MEKYDNTLDISVYGELWDENARAYIEAKYWIETRKEADKALSRYDKEQAKELDKYK